MCNYLQSGCLRMKCTKCVKIYSLDFVYGVYKMCKYLQSGDLRMKFTKCVNIYSLEVCVWSVQNV
jgi:hypothetical protein